MATTRLSQANLDALPLQIAGLRYDRSQVTPGIVHFGPSHFARGHAFKEIDDVLEFDPRWGVIGVSMMSSKARDALRDQDYLYTLTERAPNGQSNTRVIGALQDIIVASEEPERVLDVLADPRIKLVTITITQKGYGIDPATGQLDLNHPDIQNSFENLDEPSTVAGYLCLAIEKRRELGLDPLTIMSCDNITANGTVLKNVVLAFATQKSSELRRYIEEHVKFPSTMVDRIVPNTTPEAIATFEQETGIFDAWPVQTEEFFQWAIENDFSGDMPDLERAGATYTDEVYAYEMMKIRMLNGAHMALGCIGTLAGHDYVYEAMNDVALARFIEGFMYEASLTLKPLDGVDYNHYRDTLIDRLQNPAMKDDLGRLARNGVQKISNRMIESVRDAIAYDTPWSHLAFATAAWVQYLKGVDKKTGRTFDIQDKQASEVILPLIDDTLQGLARNSNGNPAPVMTYSGVFSHQLMAHPDFTKAVEGHLHAIQDFGMKSAVENLVAANDTGRRGVLRPVRS